MSRYSGVDDYLDPASGVLKNRLGITDAAMLEDAEASLVATRSYELSRTPLAGLFDLAHSWLTARKTECGGLATWLK
jgi:fido (protein-threonine AMPylation protein)